MNESQHPPAHPSTAFRAGSKRPGLLRRLLTGAVRFLLPLIVVGAGLTGAIKLYQTGPEARRSPPQKQDWLVQVRPVSLTREQAMIQAMGTVMAAREVLLQPRVSGEIIEISPSLVPGGRFAKGDFILRIDPADYELAVERARSEIANARYELKLE